MGAQTKIKWKNLIFYGLLAGIICLIILFLLNVQPIRGLGELAIGWVNGLLANPIIAPALSIIKDNWAIIGAIAVPVFGAGTAALINHIRVGDERKAKEELAQIASEQSVSLIGKDSDLKDANSELEDLRGKVAVYEKDETAMELQKTLSKTTSENQILTAKYDEAQKTIDRLQLQIDERPVIKTTEYK